MIYAFDFDGTLAITDYPKVIRANEKVLSYAKYLKKEGHTLILWTCREGEDLEIAVNWCKEQGLEFDKVNDNADDRIEEWGNDNRKIYADFYIDDHAINVYELEKNLL